MSGIMSTEESSERAYDRYVEMKESLNKTHLAVFTDTRRLIKKSVKRYERDNEMTIECIGEIKQVDIVDINGDDSLAKMMNEIRRSAGVCGPSICYSYTIDDEDDDLEMERYAIEAQDRDSVQRTFDDGVMETFWDIKKYTYAGAMKKAKEAQAARIHEYFYEKK
jgi:hypothetical protein